MGYEHASAILSYPPQPTFFALLEEASELQITHNLFFASVSMALMVPTAKSLLLLRDGGVASVGRREQFGDYPVLFLLRPMPQALKLASSALDMCSFHPTEGHSLVCKFMVAKLLLSLPEFLIAAAAATCSADLDVLAVALCSSGKVVA